MAKGAKRPTSSFRRCCCRCQMLQLSYGATPGCARHKTAEWVGGHVTPTGEALLSGYYLNELLLKLLARDDPHPVLF